MTRLSAVLLVLAVSACNKEQPAAGPVTDPPGVEPAEPEPTEPVGDAGAAAETPEAPATGRGVGEACLAAAECESGVCEGEGCGDDTPGVCADASRMCTRDLRQYCGCDGETFGASGSCPGRRYAHKEPC